MRDKNRIGITDKMSKEVLVKTYLKAKPGAGTIVGLKIRQFKAAS